MTKAETGNLAGLAARVAKDASLSGVRVSQHAIARYRERIANVSDDRIVAALSGTAIQVLGLIGRGAVILSCGARAIVQDGTVITVLPRGQRVMNWHRFSAGENF